MYEDLDLAKIRAIAEEAHKGQFRRDGVTPYIVHPQAVVSRLPDDPLAQAVGWLHDVIEDTDETEQSLLDQGVPPEVVEAVTVLTKKPGVRYEDYLKKVKTHPLAARVKLADLLSNLADGPTERQIRKYAKALLYLID